MTDPMALEVARLLTGEFSSEAQSMSDFSYFNIHLETCLVKAPTYGSLALCGASLQRRLGQPTGSVSRDHHRESVRSEIWAPLLDFQWVRTCKKDEVVGVNAGDFSLREGCDVWLTRPKTGSKERPMEKGVPVAWVGHLRPSQVTLTEDLLQSWDQGFSSMTSRCGSRKRPLRLDRLDTIVDPVTWAERVAAPGKTAPQALSFLAPAKTGSIF